MKMEKVLQNLLYLVAFVKWTAILVFMVFFGLITKQVRQKLDFFYREMKWFDHLLDGLRLKSFVRLFVWTFDV